MRGVISCCLALTWLAKLSFHSSLEGFLLRSGSILHELQNFHRNLFSGPSLQCRSPLKGILASLPAFRDDCFISEPSDPIPPIPHLQRLCSVVDEIIANPHMRGVV